MPRSIAAYISGHGYGHLAQLAPVLNILGERRPDLRLVLRTAMPEDLLKRRVRVPFSLLPGEVDVGVVQRNAISEDIPATIAAARSFFAEFSQTARQEAGRLAPYRPALVISDISPLTFPVGKQLAVPCFAVASLDWHAVYSDFLPPDDPLLATLRAAHGDCDMLIQPPLSMSMPSFAQRQSVEVIVDDAWTAPKAARIDNQKTALVMFGGAGDPPFDLNALRNMSGWRFLTLNPLPDNSPDNVSQASPKDGSTAALMQECDLVITKPGYGTLAECWQTGTPVAYAPREDFPEYPYLDGWLQSHAPCARMGMADFVSGNWLDAMQAALDCPRRWPAIGCSGAEQAANLIMQALPHRRGESSTDCHTGKAH